MDLVGLRHRQSLLASRARLALHLARRGRTRSRHRPRQRLGLEARRARVPGRRDLPGRRRCRGSRRGRRKSRLDQRLVRGAGARARARPQPRALARRRAHVHGAGSAGADGHARARRTGFEYADPFDAMGQSDRVPPMVLRQMNMEHKLLLDLLPASAQQVIGVSGTYHARADGDADRNGRGPAPAQARRRQLLRRVPAPDRAYFDNQAPSFSGVYVHTESPQPRLLPEPRRHRADRHASDDGRRLRSLGGRRHERRRRSSTTRCAASHPGSRPGRDRRHAGDHDAGRHDSAQQPGRAVRGHQRHQRGAAVDGRRRRLRRRLLPRRARRSPARRDRPRRPSTTAAPARSHGQLRRDGGRHRGQRRPACDHQRHAARHACAQRAARRHGDGQPGRACAHRLGSRDGQRRRDVLPHPARRHRHRPGQRAWPTWTRRPGRAAARP